MIRRQLAQSRPNGVSAVTLFSPDENRRYTVDLILCTNSSGAAVDITIYHDADGTTYNTQTEVLATTSLGDGVTLEFAPANGLSGYLAAGGIGVKTSSSNSVNFTAYGFIEGERI